MVSTSGVAVPELEIARSSVRWRVGKGMSEQSRAGDSAAEVKTSAIPEKTPAPEVVAEQKELVTKGCCVALADSGLGLATKSSLPRRLGSEVTKVPVLCSKAVP